MTLYYPIQAPYPVFSDIDGMPLEDGYIYIGQENQNPISNPITIYWDQDFQYPAAQPIRTLAGSPNRNGAPAPIYTNTSYSMLIQNKNGIQIYFSLSSQIIDYNADDGNLVIDGDFQTFPVENYNGTGGDPDYYRNSFIFSNSGLDWAYEIFEFEIDQTDVPNNPKHYMQLYSIGVTATSDYFKMCFCIEDLFTTYGKYLTLSFYARLPVGAGVGNTAMATSFTMKETNAAARTTGLNVQKHTLTEEWQKFTTTFKVTEIDTSITPYPDNQESALILNIWVNAGTDYDDETNTLNFTGADNAIEIADIRIERGSIANTFERTPFENAQLRVDRRMETSYQVLYDSGDAGWQTYIAAGINNFIPGFLFRQKKRTSSATVEICSADTGTAGFVYKVGTGDVAATAADISYFGFGAINLGAATAANDVYAYHYVIKDDITL